MPFAFRMPCASGWESSALLWSRPRPNWSSLVGSRRNTRANAAGTARKLSTSWASPCIARETEKETSRLGCAPEKSRLRRSLTSLQELMQRIRHHTISEQVGEINATLRGHYAYYGVAGNLRSLVKVYRVVERYWRRMLCSRSWAGRRLTWDAFNQIKERTPLLTPKLRLPYRELQALAVL